MIKERIYFETSDGKFFDKLTDAQKHEKKNTDPLIHLISKVFPGSTDLKNNIYDIINLHRDDFIKALMKDKIEEPIQDSKVDSVLNRLYEERNLPQERHKKHRIKVES